MDIIENEVRIKTINKVLRELSWACTYAQFICEDYYDDIAVATYLYMKKICLKEGLEIEDYCDDF